MDSRHLYSHKDRIKQGVLTDAPDTVQTVLHAGFFTKVCQFDEDALDLLLALAQKQEPVMQWTRESILEYIKFTWLRLLEQKRVVWVRGADSNQLKPRRAFKIPHKTRKRRMLASNKIQTVYIFFSPVRSTTLCAHFLKPEHGKTPPRMIRADGDVFIRPKDVRKQYAISASTLRQWATSGVIPALQYGTARKRLYSKAAIEQHLGVQQHGQQVQAKVGIIYARVSSRAQETSGDLQRQVQDLQTAYPSYQVVTDVASGLNFKRTGLQTLLERVHAGGVSEVVVMHKDRLCRYGLELVCFILEKAGTKLVVYGNAEAEDRTRELADDLLAITTIFVARHHGQRSGANKRRRRAAADAVEAANAVDESSAGESVQDSRLSH